MQNKRFDLFFDLHEVLANLEAVSKNYDNYLARVLLFTGIKRKKISTIHEEAFTQWSREITQLYKVFNEEEINCEEFIQKYKEIDEKWVQFILGLIPENHRKAVKPRLSTSKVEYEALANGDPILYPEVLSVLEELEKIPNLRMHIASSASSQHVKGAVELHNLYAYFCELIGYDTVGAPKKANKGKYFKNMLKLTKANPKRSIFIGDSLKEASLSLSCGMKFIMVTRGRKIEKLKRNNLEFEIVNDLTEILPIIQNILETNWNKSINL